MILNILIMLLFLHLGMLYGEINYDNLEDSLFFVLFERGKEILRGEF